MFFQPSFPFVRSGQDTVQNKKTVKTLKNKNGVFTGNTGAPWGKKKSGSRPPPPPIVKQGPKLLHGIFVLLILLFVFVVVIILVVVVLHHQYCYDGSAALP